MDDCGAEVKAAKGSAIACATVAAALVLAALAGCASIDDQLSLPSTPSDGIVTSAITEIAPADRSAQIDFEGELDSGGTATSRDWIGQVVVVNFWYAGCAPCRAEAPDLQALSAQYSGDNVVFVGVNVRDQASTAIAFAEKFGIGYPSFIDAQDGSIQLAFAGSVAPKAVPTTVILDRQGRLASRIIGRIPDRSILETLIGDTVEESP